MSFVRLDFSTPPTLAGSVIVRPTVDLICARTIAEVPACLDRLDAAWRQGLYAAGFIAYEAASALDASLETHAPDAAMPLLWFAVTDSPEPAPPAPPHSQRPTLNHWQAAMDDEAYANVFTDIQRAIRDGETYQMNYTFPLRSEFDGDAGELYAALRGAQSAAYSAWLHTPEWNIVSASPELFFHIDGDRISTRPMKGTRRRAPDPAGDRQVAAELAESAKDRAENVMIVDLLRNDLGRVAVTGSVEVDDMFRVEKYPTVWQMTSRVDAQLRDGIGLTDVLAALFPCGSVTGAPKAQTMKLIRRHEGGPRGVYCGAVGWLGPERRAVFNVPIRTLTLTDGKAVYPVGSGLVSDSDAAVEYRECLDKAHVLARAAAPSFELFETMLYKHESQLFWLFDRHMQRLAKSADYFEFPFDPGRVRDALSEELGLSDEAVAKTEGAEEDQRVRLMLAPDGATRIQVTPLSQAAIPLPRKVTLGGVPVDSQNVFLYHKTTNRAVYGDALAANPGANDVILVNERGELTESCSANIALKLDGDWLTPPVACGLLAGTLRAELLAVGELREAVLTPDDLRRADAVELINSVRGRMEAVVV